jgi:carbamoyltransferase
MRIDHHLAHAATAFLTSPFERATVIVCDTSADRELSVWLGDGVRLQDVAWPWRGSAFATLCSECGQLLNRKRRAGDAHWLEVLAQLGTGEHVSQVTHLFRYADGTFHIDPEWVRVADDMVTSEQRVRDEPIETASALQRRIGELFLEFVADVRRSADVDALCLGGGLFYNTYLNTIVRSAGIFGDVHVPINPGNAGLAVGASLLVSLESSAPRRLDGVSPFLGPEYDSEAIKATLDGCKLSYEYVTETQAVDSAAAALRRGQLVAWFQGRMEWGHRALGHRSILADPQSPYVLDNLNHFLRKRNRWRSFGVAVREEKVADLFCGPAASRYMEYEYRLRDDRLRHVVPVGASTLRVQTVTPDTGPLWTLLKRMEEAGGTGALVNTSFNAFQEPIVCSPRDAVRVFYGTGLDMLVIGRFILRK